MAEKIMDNRKQTAKKVEITRAPNVAYRDSDGFTGMAYSKDCVEEIVKDNLAPYENPPEFKQYGWICPRCGRGNAPWNATCSCLGWAVGPVWCNTGIK